MGPEIGKPGAPILDSKRFQILDTYTLNNKLILKVKYPSCTKCTFEGIKTMIFNNVRLEDAIKWTRIDPHFRKVVVPDKTNAPPPIARFLGDDLGWNMTIDFVEKCC